MAVAFRINSGDSAARREVDTTFRPEEKKGLSENEERAGVAADTGSQPQISRIHS